MAVDVQRTTSSAAETVSVNRFCDGIIGPSAEVVGTVRDGGHIVANTAPGCWGPMITPAIMGGHEVTLPVAVEGAEVGDAIVIRIRDITVTSLATASGNSTSVEAASTAIPTAPRSVRGAGHRTRPRTTGRAAALLGLSVPEAKNRATITGAIEIGRHPGVVQVTFRAPVSLLERCSLAGLAREQYG